MEVARALIQTACERGGDARRAVAREPLHLFPVANRPILAHNVDALGAAGVREVAIVADAVTGPPIRDAIGNGRDLGVSVSYLAADPRAGVEGALAAGREFAAGEPVLVQQAGALLGERLDGHLTAFAEDGLDALGLRLSRPAPATIAALPWCVFSPRAIELLAGAGRPTPNPMQGVRERGGRVRVQLVDGCLPAPGDTDALLKGNRCVLEGIRRSFDDASLGDSRVQGEVEIHPTASVRRSLVRGPVIVGPGAEICDAYLGPYTSIGARATVEGTEIEHSIVLADAELRFLGARVESSIIGRGARLRRGFDLPRAIRLSTGDGAEVVLS